MPQFSNVRGLAIAGLYPLSRSDRELVSSWFRVDSFWFSWVFEKMLRASWKLRIVGWLVRGPGLPVLELPASWVLASFSERRIGPGPWPY